MRAGGEVGEGGSGGSIGGGREVKWGRVSGGGSG